MAALLIACTLLAPLAVSDAAEPTGKNAPDSPSAIAPAAAARVRSFDDRHRSITFFRQRLDDVQPGSGMAPWDRQVQHSSRRLQDIAGKNMCGKI